MVGLSLKIDATNKIPYFLSPGSGISRSLLLFLSDWRVLQSCTVAADYSMEYLNFAIDTPWTSSFPVSPTKNKIPKQILHKIATIFTPNYSTLKNYYLAKIPSCFLLVILDSRAVFRLVKLLVGLLLWIQYVNYTLNKTYPVEDLLWSFPFFLPDDCSLY